MGRPQKTAFFKIQVAYWRTNGKTNVRIGRFTASISKADMEMTPVNLRELHADFWVILTQSPRKLIYSPRPKMCLIEYYVKNQNQVSTLV
jgi:hypothetical protein